MDFLTDHSSNTDNHQRISCYLPKVIKKTCWGKWAGKRKNITTNSEEKCPPKDNLIINFTGQELQPHEVSFFSPFSFLLFYAHENLSTGVLFCMHTTSFELF